MFFSLGDAVKSKTNPGDNPDRPSNSSPAAKRRKEKVGMPLMQRLDVFELRALGESYAAIARMSGSSKAIVETEYKRACIEFATESSEEHRARANARFDSQLLALGKAAQKLRERIELDGELSPEGEPIPISPGVHEQLTANIKTQMAITKAQAEMNGAFAPLNINHSGSITHNVITLDEVDSVLRTIDANQG